MERRLKHLNDELANILHELKTTFSEELQSTKTIPQSADDMPTRRPHLERSIELVNELRVALDPPLHTIIDGMFAFSISKALSTVVHYRVPDILSLHGPLSTTALAELTTPPLSEARLWHLLSLLSNAAGIFSYNIETNMFENNPASSLLSVKHWTRWHLWAELYPTVFYDMFAHLQPAMIDTETRTVIQIAYGVEASESLYALLARLPWGATFQETIGAGASAMAPGMLADYAWEDLCSGPICDLGGGNGEFLFTLLSARKDLLGAILELKGSAASKAARINFGMEGDGEQVKFSSVRARVLEIYEGDFFVEVPPYPFYTIRWTLHNWDDDQVAVILNNTRAAIESVRKPNSRLLIIEAVLTPGRAARPAVYGSIIMMAGSKGGQERTEKQWRDLCARTQWNLHAIHRPRNCIPCILDLRPQ